MTTLKPGAPVRRETAVYYRRRPLLVELHPGYLTLREKGKRFTLAVDYQAMELPVSSLRFATLAQRRDSLWAMFSSIERRVANEKTIPDCRGPCRTTSTAVG